MGIENISSQILVLGATGFVGRRLVKHLIQNGREVSCLVRNLRRADDLRQLGAKLIEGDVFNEKQIINACRECQTIIYLIHSMKRGRESFEVLDRKAAQNTLIAAEKTGVRRIIYLGGLGIKGATQSDHLASRHEVGDILRLSHIPVTEFRAAVIVGNGGTSFEMIHHLTNRLPVMICPRWVSTKTQPIAISDVVKYISASIECPESAGEIYDIGGPDIMTYGEMMKKVAEILGLKRLMISIPVLTPRLSSYWVNFVTPVPAVLAKSLIEGLKSETICENNKALNTFDIEPISFSSAVTIALNFPDINSGDVSNEDMAMITGDGIDDSHLLVDTRILKAAVPVERLFAVIEAIGGDNGWYFANWLWKFRGLIDSLLGGVGMRRTAGAAKIMAENQRLDFWRIEKFHKNESLVLRAEMKVWGRAWLKFFTEKVSSNESRLIQTAQYYPIGLFGLVYWYSILPIHKWIFWGLSRKIIKKALSNVN